MVRAMRNVTPAIRLMRESHQVFATDARTTARPIMDPHLARGQRAGISADWAAVSRRRKLMWAASEMIQESIMPKKAPRRMYSKALAGAQRSSTKATTIPYEETSKARIGVPFVLRRPKARGAHPVRASENSIREEMYSAALAPERAAV